MKVGLSQLLDAIAGSSEGDIEGKRRKRSRKRELDTDADAETEEIDVEML